MNLLDVIGEAQAIAGINSFEGNAVNENLFHQTIQVLNMTLRDLANEPTLRFNEKMRVIKPMESEDDFYRNSYPLPFDCVRVISVFCDGRYLQNVALADFYAFGKDRKEHIYCITEGQVLTDNFLPINLIYNAANDFKNDYNGALMTKRQLEDFRCEEKYRSVIVYKLAANLALSNNFPYAHCEKLYNNAAAALQKSEAMNKGRRNLNPLIAARRLSRGAIW